MTNASSSLHSRLIEGSPDQNQSQSQRGSGDISNRPETPRDTSAFVSRLGALAQGLEGWEQGETQVATDPLEREKQDKELGEAGLNGRAGLSDENRKLYSIKREQPSSSYDGLMQRKRRRLHQQRSTGQFTLYSKLYWCLATSHFPLD